MEFLAKNLADTEYLGKALGEKLLPGDLLLLHGEFGTGKTTLVKSVAKELGVSPDQYVSSPSFTIINEYYGRYPIFHVDLYRIDSVVELENLALDEVVFRENSITIIEWAEKLTVLDTKTLLIGMRPRLEIYIEGTIGEARKFKFLSVKLKDRFSFNFPLH